MFHFLGSKKEIRKYCRMRDIEYSSRCEAEELGRRESLSKPRGREG